MPAQSQQARHGGHAGHFLEPIDDKRLEEGREARAGLAPGDPDLLDAVVGTLHPGHLREQDGGVLAGVEVPPATRQVIVAGAEPAALGARPLLGRAGPPAGHAHCAAEPATWTRTSPWRRSSRSSSTSVTAQGASMPRILW